MIDYRAKMAQEDRDYRAAVAKLPPEIRAEWARVEESMEWFDGESWAALGYLIDWLKRRPPR